MKKIIFSFLLLVFVGVANAQTPFQKSKFNSLVGDNNTKSGTVKTDKKTKQAKKKKPLISDYLIISNLRDTTHLDTTLTINKEYKYNYLRRDNFGLMPFANVGQSYNRLTYNFKNTSLLPAFGAKAKQFNYSAADDIKYYHVPTPLTELYYKTAFTQGQQLDAFFTTNTSKQFNFSLAYKGLRSLGTYQHSLTSTGNLRMTASYKTKNKRYVANTHYTSQDFSNEENGGLKDSNIPFFESDEGDFDDRGVLEVNFQNADNLFLGKRFYLNHSFDLIAPKNTVNSSQLQLAHLMTFEDKVYTFYQSAEEASYFGVATQATQLRDRTDLEQFTNQLQLNYNNNIIGGLQFNATHNNYNYGYDNPVVITQTTIPDRLKGEVLSLGAKYDKTYKGFSFSINAAHNITGQFDGNYIVGSASYQLNPDLTIAAKINHSNAAPDFNTLLFQSNYINYNWSNQFNNVKTQDVSFQLRSNKYVNFSLNHSTINDYVYFAKGQNQAVKPFQNDKAITYLKAKIQKEFRFRKFALDNTLLYQNVQDDTNSLNVPQIVTRNSLYYSTHLYKKALYLQTGVIFNYFTAYNMDGYDPLLSEFYTQNEQQLGAFPRFDFFVNAKLRQTRIYLKAEHFNAPFTGSNYYSAPNQPFRDFKIRFGIVWNFFL